MGSRENIGHMRHRAAALSLLPLCLVLILFPLPRTLVFAQAPPPPGIPERLGIDLTASLADSAIQLPHQFVVEGSDSVLVGEDRLLVRDRDYTIDYRQGRVRLDSALVRALLQETRQPPDSTQPQDSMRFQDTTQRGDVPVRIGVKLTIIVSYRYLPFTFQESYARRSLVVVPDTTTQDTLRVARKTQPVSTADIFGPNLQKSGSLVRGFTVGSNRDLSPTSGLRLQMAGRLATDLEISAALTDENTPIQPEGTTQSLQEFDKVFIEIRSKDIQGTLGDFVLDVGGTEFARLSRKLQGAKGLAEYRTDPASGSLLLSGAITRGKYATNQFTGVEGVQGPYRLSGRNGETFIIVIAGSERVYVNGELQTRGDVNDYTIDYSLGEITFTSRRLITSASRVNVDFEYTDRSYSRSLFGGQATGGFFNNNASLSVTYFREADDPDSPLDFTMSDSARQALATAGDDRYSASLTGVTRVDSNGIYLAVDTVLAGGVPYTLYRYAPGDPAALSLVSFSYAGSGKGDYRRQQIGVFVWQGVGAGDYLPVRFVPLPESHQVVDVALKATPLKDLSLSAEYGRSEFDPNRLSTTDVSQGGNAISFQGSFAPKGVSIGDANLGDIDVTLRGRNLEEGFVPLDRVEVIEFTRKWGLDSVRSSAERQLEGLLRYSPAKGIVAGGGFGNIARGEDFDADRFDAFAAMNREGLPRVNYTMDNVRSDDRVAGTLSTWFRQKGSADMGVGFLTPAVGYEGESRTIESLQTGLAGAGSFRFDQWSAGLRTAELGRVTLLAELGWRNDDSYLNGQVAPESRSFTQQYGAKLSDWNTLSSTADLTIRKTRYTDDFQATGKSDISTVLVRNTTRYTPLNRGVETDLFYETMTERSSRQQRVFVRVSPGTGNYRYRGDLNGNGLADDEEFEQTRFDGDYVTVTLPSDELVPVINLRASARLRITPRRFLEKPEGWIEDVVSVLTSETYARVDEKSTEADLAKIYLMHFSHFQQDSTTIAGTSLFSQDLLLFEGQPDFSARLRYLERGGLTSLSGGPERLSGRELSLRLRWQLVPEIANQLDVVSTTNQVSESPSPSRIHDVDGTLLSFDISYRPVQSIEYGMRIDVARSTDWAQAPALQADINTQTVRGVFGFERVGQLRVSMAREEVQLDRAVVDFAYELTNGRSAGISWLWGVAFEYRVTSFIQASASYDGRSEGGAPIVHTGRAEVRAFF